MTITRRQAIKNCIIVSIGTAIIPSCSGDKSKPAFKLKNFSLTSEQELLVTEISETIIPTTDTPGSKDTLTHLFVLKMIDDMYSKEEQKKFLKGMRDFDNMAKDRIGNSFLKASPVQREELFASIIDNKSKDISEDVQFFLQLIKKLTVQGYMSSKYYLSNVRIYKLVPGKFYGCIPVTSLKSPSI